MPLFGTGAVTFTGTQFTELAAAIPEFSKQTGYTQDGILGAGGTYAIQNNGVAVAVYQHSATPPNANYSVWADIAKLSGSTGAGPRMGVCGRMAAGAETFYFAIYTHNLTNIRLFKVVAGTQTQLGSSYTYTLTGTAAKLELVMDGSNISVKLNNTTVIGPVTDTAITAAGKAGIYLFDMRETGVADSGSLDNFDAAALAAAPVLSSPTVVSTGNTIATVRVTTDTAPSGSSTLAVRTRAAAAPAWTAAEVLASPTATITSGASGARDFNLTGLVNGTALVADFAQTGPSNVVSTASFTPSTVPGAPTIGTAVAGNAQATVNGTAPASNGGATITGYRSTATPGGSTVTGASLPITHTGLTNGTAYTFTLAAQNANGYGAESASSNSVTPSAGSPPPPPPPPGSATLTLTGFKQWTGTAWTSITVPFVKVCRASTGAVVLEVSSAAVNASGNMTITSGSLTAGVVYVVFGFNTDGTLSFKKTVTAT